MFPWSLILLILGPGVLFTLWCVYKVLKMAHDEITQDDQIL